ncbi:ligninase H2 precursor [Stachybotrys elegans]|uniref:Peroxidase n=1 Tax=Stachybotrys elegans TaxID=80388 RepID=A0A8K0T1V2_9HYPO|nr:ligninase H2 precursor [Stachybotrys elegans]
MRSFPIAVTALLAAVDLVSAYPGMGQQMDELMSLKERQNTPELIGDLLTLADEELTPTGAAIKAILLNQAAGQDATSNVTLPVPPKGSAACAADTCCIWKHIADEMASAMVGSALRCNNLARAAIRLGFHDAGTWSKSTVGGGADGSAVLARECENRPSNNGLQNVCSQMRAWHQNYQVYGISMADLIQMGANVATVVCPLGPRVRTFVGRVDSSTPNPDGLLPGAFQSADELIAMFEDKTISPAALIALVGAHSTSQQRFVDQGRAGDPQDRTPGVWDVNFYDEIKSTSSPARVFKFQSDINLSVDPRTSGTWNAFMSPNGQRPWNGAYARAYVRLSLLGVNNINDLTECTKVLPPPITDGFPIPDEVEMGRFLQGPRNRQATDALLEGDLLPEFVENL